jgi:hypothetical protein
VRLRLVAALLDHAAQVLHGAWGRLAQPADALGNRPA